jgi:chromosomal replication initiation ATPase DnaA
MIQPALPLDWPADEADDAFIVTPSNAAAVRHLDAIGTWPVSTSLLTGPRKSGRSLLGRIFAHRSGGRLIDDADRRDERSLFSAWNEAQATRQPLLLITEVPPPEWRVSLADLRSRLAATPVVTLGPPDDELIGALLAQLLARRGLAVGSEVVAYLVPRSPRSHIGVIGLVDALDAASLAQRRAVTIPLAREVLGPIDAPAEEG